MSTAATNRPINRKVVLTQFVTGMVGPEHFRIEEEPARAPEAGELLIKADTLSIDDFIRTSLNAVEGLQSAGSGRRGGGGAGRGAGDREQCAGL